MTKARQLAEFASDHAMFRNKIINGDMRMDQRNAGSSVTPASGVYTVDRWVYEATQSGKVACQQVSTAPSRFVNSLKLTSNSAYTVAAGDVFQIVQRIEGSAISELAWGTTSASTVTLSFKAYSSLTGTFGGFLRNSASDRYYVFTYSIPVANTWTDISITIPGDTTGTWLTTNGYGLGIGWSLGCGSTYQTTAGSWGSGNNRGATGQVDLVATNGATLYITAVQLEIGTVATPFEHRPISIEKSLCYRYYYRMTANPVAVTVSGTTTTNASYIGFAVGRAYSTTAGTAIIFLPEPLRTSPPVFNYSPIVNNNWDYVITDMSLVNRQLADTRTVAIYASISVAQSQSSWLLSTGNIGSGSSSTDSVFMDFSAEL